MGKKIIIEMVKMAILYIGTFFCALTILSACSSPEGESIDNIAENGISGVEVPKGCEIMDNIDEFESVSQDQAFNAETDSNPSFYILNGTDAGDALYCFSGSNWLCYFDKKSGDTGMVCGKPDCEHSNDDCNAFLHQTWGVQYYNGYLYTVTSLDMQLVKISLDGSEREYLGKLANDQANALNWTIHRGYIYYCYTWNIGATEDFYYLNNSNCIYRKSLEKDSEPECIMALPLLSYLYECQFVGAGSYVYIKAPTADETTGQLYRYNTENNKLEWFKEWGDDVSGVFVKDNKIYYSENDRDDKTTTIYEYDSTTKEKSIFCEVTGLADGIKYDEDFIYIPYEKTGEWQTGIWNWEGEYIAEKPSFEKLSDERIIRDWLGTDDKYIYIHCIVITDSEEENIYAAIMGNSYETMEYIEKDDILDGEYEIKEWSKIGSE